MVNFILLLNLRLFWVLKGLRRHKHGLFECVCILIVGKLNIVVKLDLRGILLVVHIVNFGRVLRVIVVLIIDLWVVLIWLFRSIFLNNVHLVLAILI